MCFSAMYKRDQPSGPDIMHLYLHHRLRSDRWYAGTLLCHPTRLSDLCGLKLKNSGCILIQSRFTKEIATPTIRTERADFSRQTFSCAWMSSQTTTCDEFDASCKGASPNQTLQGQMCVHSGQSVVYLDYGTFRLRKKTQSFFQIQSSVQSSSISV